LLGPLQSCGRGPRGTQICVLVVMQVIAGNYIIQEDNESMLDTRHKGRQLLESFPTPQNEGVTN